MSALPNGRRTNLNTQSLEPTLIPKLRIHLAEFPYLHCSTGLEAAHLGDLMRFGVRLEAG